MLDRMEEQENEEENESKVEEEEERGVDEEGGRERKVQTRTCSMKRFSGEGPKIDSWNRILTRSIVF